MENYVLLYDGELGEKFGKIRFSPNHPEGTTTFVNHPKVKRSWMWGGGTPHPEGKMSLYLCFELNDGHKETIECSDSDGDAEVIQKANEYLNTL